MRLRDREARGQQREQYARPHGGAPEHDVAHTPRGSTWASPASGSRAGRASAAPPSAKSHRVTAGISHTQSTPAAIAHATAAASSAANSSRSSPRTRRAKPPSSTRRQMPSRSEAHDAELAEGLQVERMPVPDVDRGGALSRPVDLVGPGTAAVQAVITRRRPAATSQCSKRPLSLRAQQTRRAGVPHGPGARLEVVVLVRDHRGHVQRGGGDQHREKAAPRRRRPAPSGAGGALCRSASRRRVDRQEAGAQRPGHGHARRARSAPFDDPSRGCPRANLG